MVEPSFSDVGVKQNKFCRGDSSNVFKHLLRLLDEWTAPTCGGAWWVECKGFFWNEHSVVLTIDRNGWVGGGVHNNSKSQMAMAEAFQMFSCPTDAIVAATTNGIYCQAFAKFWLSQHTGRRKWMFNAYAAICTLMIWLWMFYCQNVSIFDRKGFLQLKHTSRRVPLNLTWRQFVHAQHTKWCPWRSKIKGNANEHLFPTLLTQVNVRNHS